MNTGRHRPSALRHLIQLGRKRRLKHSSQTLSGKIGSVASNNKKSGLARVKISTQFCRGTIGRLQSVRMAGGYSPESMQRQIAFFHGFRAGSDTTLWKRFEREEAVMRESISSSARMSAMSSTGRASRDDIIFICGR